MTSQQARLAFEKYESDVLEKSSKPDLEPVREAFLKGYSQCETDIGSKPFSKATILWFIAAAFVSIGLWGVIFFGVRAIF